MHTSLLTYVYLYYPFYLKSDYKNNRSHGKNILMKVAKDIIPTQEYIVFILFVLYKSNSNGMYFRL